MRSSKDSASTSFKAPDSSSLQLNDQGKLRHFLTIDGLSKDTLIDIMDVAESFSGVADQAVKKVPLLRGKRSLIYFSKIALERVRRLSWRQNDYRQTLLTLI